MRRGFEYAAPGTCQTEWSSQTEVCYLFQMGTCNAQGQKFFSLQSGLRAKATNTAMILKNNHITPNRALSPFQQFFGKGKISLLPCKNQCVSPCTGTIPIGLIYFWLKYAKTKCSRTGTFLAFTYATCSNNTLTKLFSTEAKLSSVIISALSQAYNITWLTIAVVVRMTNQQLKHTLIMLTEIRA